MVRLLRRLLSIFLARSVYSKTRYLWHPIRNSKVTDRIRTAGRRFLYARLPARARSVLPVKAAEALLKVGSSSHPRGGIAEVPPFRSHSARSLDLREKATEIAERPRNLMANVFLRRLSASGRAFAVEKDREACRRPINTIPFCTSLAEVG